MATPAGRPAPPRFPAAIFFDLDGTLLAPGAVLTIGEPVRNWVQEKDLPRLILLLDSPVPCASVMSTRSSFWPGVSTVGEQAAFMILGFRKGWYPPDLHSGRMPSDVKAEIRAWWAARKQ